MEACPCKPVPASLSLARVGCWQEGRHAGPDLITGNFGLHKTFPQKNPREGQSMQGRGGENRKGGRGRQIKATVFLSSHLLLLKLLMVNGAAAPTSDRTVFPDAVSNVQLGWPHLFHPFPN